MRFHIGFAMRKKPQGNELSQLPQSPFMSVRGARTRLGMGLNRAVLLEASRAKTACRARSRKGKEVHLIYTLAGARRPHIWICLPSGLTPTYVQSDKAAGCRQKITNLIPVHGTNAYHHEPGPSAQERLNSFQPSAARPPEPNARSSGCRACSSACPPH